MFKVGTTVGAGRWPNRKAHPEQWQKPLAGQVLDFCDVRAWANSIHFPTDNPHPGEVMGLALRLKEQGVLADLTPVLWDFGTHERVYWEQTALLRPYAEDVSLWRASRAMRIDELQHPRRRKQRVLAEFLSDDTQHLAAQKVLPLTHRA